MKQSTETLLQLMRKLESPAMQNLVFVKLHKIEHGRKTPFLLNTAQIVTVEHEQALAKHGYNSTIFLNAPLEGATRIYAVELPSELWSKVSKQIVAMLSVAGLAGNESEPEEQVA